jgi:hypothetical protein
MNKDRERAGRQQTIPSKEDVAYNLISYAISFVTVFCSPCIFFKLESEYRKTT